MNARRAAVASVFIVALSAETAFATANVNVRNLDEGTGVGFDDPSPRSPVGGNDGATLGEQRLTAFRRAAQTWADVLTSPVEIVIEATMGTPLPCGGGAAVLGQASPSTAVLAPSPRRNGQTLAHPIALANAISGQDLDPTGPDIVAEFNPSVDEGCTPHGWYYGLDQNGGDSADFYSTVLHELGHGLGFGNLTDPSSGEFVLGAPDVFSVFAFDDTSQKAWIDMTAGERVTSQGDARHLLWNGPETTRAAPTFLEAGFPVLSVTPTLDGLFGRLSEEEDGPKVSGAGVTGTLVLPDPAHGCDAPTNAAEIAGKVALVDPIGGGAQCSSIQAVIDMEAIGAIAVISIDPEGFDPPRSILGKFDPRVIPAVQVGVHDGDLLKTAVGRTVSLKPGATRAGADANGRVYLYASDPYLEGSSVGHWDPVARRNLLMEPNDTNDANDVDLTRYFMRDIGWPACGDGTVQAAEECDDGNLDDRDGCSAKCTKEVCGDGTVNQTVEKCDDGNTVSNDGCSATCQPEVCGDGAVNQPSEKCDDGNAVDGDGCETDCTVTPGKGPVGSGAGGSAGGGAGPGGGAEGSGSSDSGCGCRVAQKSATPLGNVAPAIAALLALLRRRKRTRPASALRGTTRSARAADDFAM